MKKIITQPSYEDLEKQIAELKEALIKIADFCDNKGVISDIAKQALK